MTNYQDTSKKAARKNRGHKTLSNADLKTLLEKQGYLKKDTKHG